MGFTSTKTTCLYTAINFELGGGKKLSPEWWEIIPADKFKGLDGRKWQNPTPQAVIDATLSRGRDVVIDINHSTQLKAPKGEKAPSQGKIRATAQNWEVRSGGVWGRPDLNKKGSKLMRNEAYQGYSPVFDHDTRGNVLFVRSLGLTNSQNLLLTALNQESNNPLPKGTESMSKIALAIATALNLEVSASEEDAVTAINKLKDDRTTALNREMNPSLDKFVPVADHNLMKTRAETAESSLKEKSDADLKTAINTEISKALDDGKISPASKDYHTASCAEEGGLERFKAFVADAPKLVGGDTGLDGKDPEKQSKTALNSEQKEAIRLTGASADVFAKEIK